jgi:hypothetical protein
MPDLLSSGAGLLEAPRVGERYRTGITDRMLSMAQWLVLAALL